MRIGIVKPDWGIVGGFELVLDRVAAELTARGHQVTRTAVRVGDLPRAPFGVRVEDDAWQRASEWFRYATMVDAFSRVDPGPCDVVLSTQPPSFAVDHPRQLSLFYHHLRVFYDLSDAYVASGMVDDVERHRRCEELVRRIDEHYLRNPRWFLAGSGVVAERLRRYNGLADNVSVFHAGAIAEPPDDPGPVGPTALCVSRSEFAKRTELFVLGMRMTGGVPGALVGGGGRLDFVRRFDWELSRPDVDAGAVDPDGLWRSNHAGVTGPPAAEWESNVSFRSHVAAAELDAAYRGALCVVAPAYNEDYGLTAIEAMQYGRPLVVCSDGGGLVEFVEDGVTGFVVEPTGWAIAAAVTRLANDRGLAQRMGAAAREAAAGWSWARAMREFEAGLEQAAS